MATRFGDLEELLDDALELPVRGRDGETRVYRIPSPPAEDGLRVQRLTTLAATLVAGGEAIDTQALDDDQERDLIEMCLGPAHAEMLADGVDWAWLRHAGLTAMFWIINDLDTAEAYWQAAGDPTRMAAPNRETRRAAAKKSGSAAATGTRKPARTSGTSARKGTGSARRVAKT